MTTIDRGLHFEPTVDELAVLKKLELGEPIYFETAMREHLSRRLLEAGMVRKDTDGRWCITPSGRELIRRQEG